MGRPYRIAITSASSAGAGQCDGDAKGLRTTHGQKDSVAYHVKVSVLGRVNCVAFHAVYRTGLYTSKMLELLIASGAVQPNQMNRLTSPFRLPVASA
jgi:hypothetical protein